MEAIDALVKGDRAYMEETYMLYVFLHLHFQEMLYTCGKPNRMRYAVLSLLTLTLWVSVGSLGVFTASAQTLPSQRVPVQEAQVVTYSPTSPKKLTWWQKTKLFFKSLFATPLSSDETLIIILGVLLSLIGLTPFAIMLAGLLRKRDDWLLHFIINLLIIVIAWALFFFTCGIGVWLTIALLLIAFVHAIWYVVTKK